MVAPMDPTLFLLKDPFGIFQNIFSQLNQFVNISF